MSGREEASNNSVFFACSLIDFIGQETKNRRIDVVNALGRNRIEKIIDLADVYHGENIEEVSDRFIQQAGIATGSFDNVASTRYAVPSHWDIGKVCKRLALMIAEDEDISLADAVMLAYQSSISKLIDDYNGSFFHDSPQAIFAAYKYGNLE